MKRALSLVCIVLVAALATGCKSGTAGKVISVQVSPTDVNVVISTTLQFSATVTDTNNRVVTWSVVGGSANGTISSTGLFTAPATVPSPAMVTIMAVSAKDRTKSGSAQVTITTTAGPSNVTVSVSPVAPSVTAFGTQQFTPMVSGTTNTAVTWQVNGVNGGSRNLGFISATGLYVAPGRVPTSSDGGGGSVATTFIVTAVAQADPTASGSAVVTVVPANQNAQSGAVKLGTSGSNVNDFNASNGSIECCGGTLGSLVTRAGTQYVLGNTHVLGRSDAGVAGDGIVQPGLIDVDCDSTQTATVANLTQFANLETESHAAAAANVDAAIAQVVSGKVDTTGSILYLGASADANGVPIAGAPHAGSGVPATLNMNVAKSGRSTGLTCSAVLATNVSTSVQYTKNCDGTGTPFDVHYLNQVDVAGGDFSAEGDSGSLIVSQTTADPVALLYAGSDSDTVGNPVGPVLSFFASGLNSATFVGGATHAVLGCSLPNAPQSAGLKVQAKPVPTAAMHLAVTARDAYGPELLARPEVQAVGVGASYDNPAEAAIVFFVTKGQARGAIPAEVDGVRTRVVEGDLFARRGAISAADTAANEQSVAPPQVSYSITDAEFQRAKLVHAARGEEWMKQAGVQGVGISSSVDAQGEAALMIFVIRGAEHAAIPAVIDGLRTRVRESSRFRAGKWGNEPRRACRVPSSEDETAGRDRALGRITASRRLTRRATFVPATELFYLSAVAGRRIRLPEVGTCSVGLTNSFRGKTMKSLLVACAILLASTIAICKVQQNSDAADPDYKITPEDIARKNPVKTSPEGLAEARKMYNYDCAMCHGQHGDGKGEIVESMKLTMRDWRDPASLTGKTDGELFYIITKGKGKMTGEGDRQTEKLRWNLVNLVRSMAAKGGAAAKPAAANSNP